jgi:hypothetical protein
MKWIVGLGIFTGIVAIVMLVIGAMNEGNRLENNIIAQYEENKNKLSTLSTSVMEAAQVPEMAKNDLKEVVESAMQGRYGDGGSKAYVQAITEAYPGQIDPSLYVRIQNMIESGRRDFSAEQTKLNEKTRIYKTRLGEVPGGLIMKMVGYPKINFKDYEIIISDYTADAFTTKRDKGIQLGK